MQYYLILVIAAFHDRLRLAIKAPRSRSTFLSNAPSACLAAVVRCSRRGVQSPISRSVACRSVKRHILLRVDGAEKRGLVRRHEKRRPPACVLLGARRLPSHHHVCPVRNTFCLRFACLCCSDRTAVQEDLNECASFVVVVVVVRVLLF